MHHVLRHKRTVDALYRKLSPGLGSGLPRGTKHVFLPACRPGLSIPPVPDRAECPLFVGQTSVIHIWVQWVMDHSIGVTDRLKPRDTQARIAIMRYTRS